MNKFFKHLFLTLFISLNSYATEQDETAWKSCTSDLSQRLAKELAITQFRTDTGEDYNRIEPHGVVMDDEFDFWAYRLSSNKSNEVTYSIAVYTPTCTPYIIESMAAYFKLREHEITLEEAISE